MHQILDQKDFSVQCGISVAHHSDEDKNLKISEYVWDWFPVLLCWIIKFYFGKETQFEVSFQNIWALCHENAQTALQWLQWYCVVFISCPQRSLKQGMMSAKCFTQFCWSSYDVRGINKRLLQIINLDPLNSRWDMKGNGSPDIKLHPNKSIQLKLEK